MMVIKMSIFPF